MHRGSAQLLHIFNVSGRDQRTYSRCLSVVSLRSHVLKFHLNVRRFAVPSAISLSNSCGVDKLSQNIERHGIHSRSSCLYKFYLHSVRAHTWPVDCCYMHTFMKSPHSFRASACSLAFNQSQDKPFLYKVLLQLRAEQMMV